MDTFITIDWGDHFERGGEPYGEQRIDALMRRIAEAGATGVLWRTDGAGLICYKGTHGRREDQAQSTIRDELAAVYAECDPMAVAVEAAHRHELKIFSWTTLWDSWRQNFDEAGNVTGDFTDPFFAGHDDYWLTSRDGTKFCEGVPCYAIEEVVEHRLAQIKEIAAYDIDGFFLCSRSHSRSGWTPKEDYFGYNEPIVAEYRRRVGVGITDESFCRDAWRRAHGHFITEFFRRIRDATKGKTLWAGISPNNNWLLAQNMYPSHPFSCTVHRDWIRWLREDILDGLVLELSRFEPHDMAELQNYQMVGRALDRTVAVWRNIIIRHDRAGSDASGSEVIGPDVIRQRQAEMQDAGLDAVLWHEAAALESSDIACGKTAPERSFDNFNAHWDAFCES